MTVFDTMAATIFADPNLAAVALYRPGGAGMGTEIRVLRTNPDRVGNFGAGRFIQATCLIESRTIDTPDLAEGDTFEIASILYTVQADPRRDNDRRIWTAEVMEP